MESLAHLIAGEGAIPEILELARRIAEAQIDLQRVRYARHQFLSNQLDNPYYDSRANVRVKMSLIGKFLRPNAPEISMTALTKLRDLDATGSRQICINPVPRG